MKLLSDTERDKLRKVIQGRHTISEDENLEKAIDIIGKCGIIIKQQIKDNLKKIKLYNSKSLPKM